MEADIHSFESFAALDGEGIRYAVFFTGCPLRCVCCHNPDAWFPSGRKYTSEDLARRVRRYAKYFKNGGGVTFSGGEPLLNAAFINETAALLKADGIRYALDTSGAAALTEEVRKAVDNAEMVLLDIKYPNSEMYEKYTGGDFPTFLRFAEYLSETGKRVWYRTVIIPGINDSESMIDKYTGLIARWNRPEKYELLAFHTMGFYKYEELQIENPLKGTPPLDAASLNRLQAYLDAKGAVDICPANFCIT